jgi:virginiamycin A acetyltransferase
MADGGFDPRSANERNAGRIRADPERLDVKGSLRIGFFTSLTGDLKVRGQVTIGKYCAIGDNCRLIASSHDPQCVNLQIRLQKELGSSKGSTSRGEIEIGNNVWFGDDVTVLSGVKVGDGAILGAGAVATTDIPPFAIYGGIPARHLRWRFREDVRRQLQEIRWWDWSWERILENRRFFDTIIGQDEYRDLHALLEAPGPGGRSATS